MRLTKKTAALSASLVLAGSVLAAGPATAAPKGDGGTLTLTCGTVTTPVVVNGNGDWTPAHALNSNQVFIPVGFSNVAGQVLNASNEIIDSFTDTDKFKPGQRTGQSVVPCTFFGQFGPAFDPDSNQVITVTFGGNVLMQARR